MLSLRANELGFLTVPFPASYPTHEVVQTNTRKLLKVVFSMTLLHSTGATNNTDTVFFSIRWGYKLNVSLNGEVGVLYSLAVPRAI